MNLDRARGVLCGVACGDALGRPVEFMPASEIRAQHGQLDEMIGHGTWNQPAGTITDDTEQALCIARSLAEQHEFDPADIAERFVAWYDSNPFDIGRMTMKSLSRLKHGDEWDEAGQHVWESSPEGQNAGNGSVMRCAPLAIPYATNRDRLVEVSRQSSQITHADPRCTFGCVVLNLTVAGLLEDADTPLQDALDDVGSDAPSELVTALQPACLWRFTRHVGDVRICRPLATDGTPRWVIRRECREGDRDCGQSRWRYRHDRSDCGCGRWCAVRGVSAA
jgi:ADP-ribosyl-[dinitrogen reductase] hydrolase